LILLQEIISMGANSAWDDELDFIFGQYSFSYLSKNKSTA